jgi:hypothetical protein
MHSIFEKREMPVLPQGVRLLALVFLLLAGLIGLYGYLLSAGRIAFTKASWLIGSDIAQMGPIIFVVAAGLYATCGAGLLTRQRWARWLAIVLLVAGLAEQVPTVSAAVAEFHWLAIGREALLFVTRVACLRYLFQEDVRDGFDRR